VVADGNGRFGRLDVIVANAGVLSRNWLREMSEQQCDTVVDVSLSGTCRTLRSAVPPMIVAAHGHIANGTGPEYDSLNSLR
jgi:NADP-dependent 3-hydroxy acid dehydrogenase YdfG